MARKWGKRESRTLSPRKVCFLWQFLYHLRHGTKSTRKSTNSHFVLAVVISHFLLFSQRFEGWGKRRLSGILNLLDMTLEYAEINARNRFISPSLFRSPVFALLWFSGNRENICVINFERLVMTNYFSDASLDRRTRINILAY